MRLQNKIVLVTGASRGIGRAVSLAFAREGADVFVHYRSDSVAAERVADDIHGLGRQAWLLQADLSEPDQIETLFTNLYKNCDVLDILVNNAGFEFGKPFDEFTTREWDDILNVNLRAVFLCMKHAVKRMRARGSGSIINISSIHDTVPRPNFAPYCVSKAGLLMLTKTTALELAKDNIRVNAISPGAILTDMNRKSIQEAGDAFLSHIPMHRVGEVSDVTGAAIYLAGNESAYVTGTTLYIDGAYRLHTIRI